MNGTQRRWGRRVRKQARKEVMKLAETKRAFVFNEGWNTWSGPIGIGYTFDDTYISNVFGFPTLGAGDQNFIANQIVDPLAVFNLSVNINWSSALASMGGTLTADVCVDVYLIASQAQYTTTTVPRITTAGEDTELWMKPPTFGGRASFTHTINGQSVLVIKHKRRVFKPPNQITEFTTGVIRMKKRFKGTKTYDTSFNLTTGVQTQSTFLRGWNFYWLVQMSPNTISASAAQPGNPFQLFGDRYLYFKDL